MCTGCFTGVEAALVQGTAGVVIARSGVRRVTEWARSGGRELPGQRSLDRRRAAHRANAAFLAGIGLDPDRVLGPPPTGAGG